MQFNKMNQDLYHVDDILEHLKKYKARRYNQR